MHMRKLKAKILMYLLRQLTSVVVPEDLDDAYNTLSKERKTELKLQAQDFKEMRLWKWLHEEMMKVAMVKLYQSKNPEDLLFAQACIWMEEVRKKKVDNLAK